MPRAVIQFVACDPNTKFCFSPNQLDKTFGLLLILGTGSQKNKLIRDDFSCKVSEGQTWSGPEQELFILRWSKRIFSQLSLSFLFQKCENCPLECQGATISSLEDLYRFKGCTIITGDLTIQVRGGEFAWVANTSFNFDWKCSTPKLFWSCFNFESLVTLF